MTGTETPQNVTTALPSDAAVQADVTRHEVAAQAQTALPDPVIPVAPQPVAAVAVNEQDISMRELAQMVGAMVFVFCFAALGFHAVFYAGY